MKFYLIDENGRQLKEIDTGGNTDLATLHQYNHLWGMTEDLENMDGEQMREYNSLPLWSKPKA